MSKGKEVVVIDGANVAYEERSAGGKPKLSNLLKVRRELEEQILPDGGHFERSPMYHAMVLEDLLDLLQLPRVYPGLFKEEDVTAWRERFGGPPED